MSPKILLKSARPHPEEVQKIAVRMAMVELHQTMTKDRQINFDNLHAVLQQLRT